MNRSDKVELNFGRHGILTYCDGWFVYSEDNGHNSVLTREDARYLEAWFEYAVMDINCKHQGGYPENFGYWKTQDDFYYMNRRLECEELSSPGNDAEFSDVLTIPAQVGAITINHVHAYSFRKLGIKQVILPDSVKTVGREAFSLCPHLERVTAAPDIYYADKVFYDTPLRSHYQDGVSYAGNAVLKAASDISGCYTVREGTTSISPHAFAQCKKIEEVILPDSVSYIGEGAFEGCENLKSVTMPHTLRYGLNAYVFNNCHSLSHITLPEGITCLSSLIFGGCTSLKKVNIPSTVTKICDHAFRGSLIENEFNSSDDICLYMDHWLLYYKEDYAGTLRVEEGIVGVAEQTYRKKALTGLILPGSVKYVNRYSFNTSTITEISLAEGLEQVGWGVFDNTNITQIYIPATVQKLVDSFNNCKLLHDVYVYNAHMQFGESYSKKVLSSRLQEPIKVHGYVGSTAEEYCRQEWAQKEVTFVAL